MSAGPASRLTTAQAETRTGASRFALSRAAKAGELHPIRDNRGGLLWDPAELDAWAHERGPKRARAERAQDTAQAEIAALRARLADLEADRDRWHAMATRLADRPARRWWPF